MSFLFLHLQDANELKTVGFCSALYTRGTLFIIALNDFATPESGVFGVDSALFSKLRAMELLFLIFLTNVIGIIISCGFPIIPFIQ